MNLDSDAMVRRYTQVIGDGFNTHFLIHHGLQSMMVLVQVTDRVTGEAVCYESTVLNEDELRLMPTCPMHLVTTWKLWRWTFKRPPRWWRTVYEPTEPPAAKSLRVVVAA